MARGPGEVQIVSVLSYVHRQGWELAWKLSFDLHHKRKEVLGECV